MELTGFPLIVAGFVFFIFVLAVYEFLVADEEYREK